MKVFSAVDHSFSLNFLEGIDLDGEVVFSQVMIPYMSQSMIINSWTSRTSPPLIYSCSRQKIKDHGLLQVTFSLNHEIPIHHFKALRHGPCFKKLGYRYRIFIDPDWVFRRFGSELSLKLRLALKKPKTHWKWLFWKYIKPPVITNYFEIGHNYI